MCETRSCASAHANQATQLKPVFLRGNATMSLSTRALRLIWVLPMVLFRLAIVVACAMGLFSLAMLVDKHVVGGTLGRNAPVGLHDMVLALVPEEYNLLQKHHDAGEDAKMTMKIVHALQHLVAQFR